MKIENFQQRDKALKIYNKFFNPLSEDCLDYSFFDDLNFFGGISHEEQFELLNKFEEIGDNLYNEIQQFEKSKI